MRSGVIFRKFPREQTEVSVIDRIEDVRFSFTALDSYRNVVQTSSYAPKSMTLQLTAPVNEGYGKYPGVVFI